MHPVVDLLNEFGVAKLAEHCVKVVWSTVHPEKFTANYDMVNAIDSDPIAQECRGLVLAQTSGEPGGPGSYKVVAQPFRRFFNHGQGAAAELDWSTVSFEEKLDGTLCIVYWYKDQWNVATRGRPDADIVTGSTGLSFTQHFWKAIKQPGHEQEYLLLLRETSPLEYDSGPIMKHHTLCFELTAPDNQIVLPYNDTKLTLLAAFETQSGLEMAIPDAWGIRRPLRYTFGSLEECMVWVHAQPGTVLEGLVAVDAKRCRVKLKNSQYLAVMRIMTLAGSDTGVMTLILSGTVDDALPWLPAARRPHIQAMRHGTNMWTTTMDHFISTLKGETDRKTVALKVQSSHHKPWMGIVMGVWAGKYANTAEWIQDQRTLQGGISPSMTEKITTSVLAYIKQFDLDTLHADTLHAKEAASKQT